MNEVMGNNARRTIFWRAESEGTGTLKSGVPLRGQNLGLQDKLNKKNALLPGKEILAIPDQSDGIITMGQCLACVPYSPLL